MDEKDPLEEILGIFDDDITDMSTQPNMLDIIKEWKEQKAYIEKLEQILFQIIEARNLHATVDTALARRIDEVTQEDEIVQGFSKWKDEEGRHGGR